MINIEAGRQAATEVLERNFGKNIYSEYPGMKREMFPLSLMMLEHMQNFSLHSEQDFWYDHYLYECLKNDPEHWIQLFREKVWTLYAYFELDARFTPDFVQQIAAMVDKAIESKQLSVIVAMICRVRKEIEIKNPSSDDFCKTCFYNMYHHSICFSTPGFGEFWNHYCGIVLRNMLEHPRDNAKLFVANVRSFLDDTEFAFELSRKIAPWIAECKNILNETPDAEEGMTKLIEVFDKVEKSLNAK